MGARLLGTIWNFVSVPVSLLLVLTIVVFIHELGHFLLARWCGVTVQAFSIGFGREIFGFTDRYGTRWKLAWIPLGGYVRFVDDENAASAPSRDAVERMTPAERAGAFQNKPLRHRALIVAAGPAFNVISALIFLLGLFWLIGVDGRSAVIDGVEPGRAAATAGIQPGDRVVEANGRGIHRWVELQRLVNRSADTPIDLVLERGGNRVETVVTPDRRKTNDFLGGNVELGDLGIVKWTPARIGWVQPGSPAERAGLLPGDLIVSVDGRSISHFGELQKIVSSNAGTPIDVLVERSGQKVTLAVTPEQVKDAPGRRIGIAPRGEPDRRYSFLESLRFSSQEVLYYSEEMVRSIPRLPAAIGKVLSFQKQSDLGGPVAIAEMSRHAVENGLGAFVGWLAVFSIMLGIMNLLPIPLLDGGHLMFYAIEAIRGRPLDERKQEIGFKIGMAVLGTMMFAAIFGDIMRKLGLG